MAAVSALDSSLDALPGRHLAARGLGVLLVSVLPALFWTELLNAGALSVGVRLSTQSMAMFGISVMAFLAAVCAPLMLRDEPPA